MWDNEGKPFVCTVKKGSPTHNTAYEANKASTQHKSNMAFEGWGVSKWAAVSNGGRCTTHQGADGEDYTHLPIRWIHIYNLMRAYTAVCNMMHAYMHLRFTPPPPLPPTSPFRTIHICISCIAYMHCV